MSAWTGEGEQVEDIQVGECVFMLNPHFRDGTRLRVGPDKESKFTDQYILNDVEVEVLDVAPTGFANVTSTTDAEPAQGWVRVRNLTRAKRQQGIPTAKLAFADTGGGGGRIVQSGNTVSNLMPTTNDEMTLSKTSTAGFDRLMAINGVKAGMMDEHEHKRVKHSLSVQGARIRDQLRRRRRLTLDPHSKLVQRWDAVTGLALVYTATITPFEVCLLPPMSLDQMPTDPLSWANRVVDAAFLVDIVLQCFLAYQEAPDRGGTWVHDNYKIIMRYARSWMLLDIFTAVPIDVIIAAYEHGQMQEGVLPVVDSQYATLLRIVRMLRLAKLARILRASRILRRWQSHLGISFAHLALVKFGVLILIATHWQACLWVLVGRLNPPPNDDDGNPMDPPPGAFGYNWIHSAKMDETSPIEIYGVAVFVAFGSITSGSSGPINPVTPFEYYFLTVMSVLGSGVWAYVLSNGCGIIATLNPNALHYRHMMDELNYFARDKGLPKKMTVKLREFLSQTAHVHRQARYDELLGCFSARLRADAALHWAKDTLSKVSYFRDTTKVEDEFLASIALTLKSRVFCRTEYMPVASLLVLERGIASKDGRIVTKGACLGEDMVLASLTFRDLEPAIALTFVVQTACLEKKDLEALLTDFPHARREVRAASFRIAFSRAIVQLAKLISRNHAMGLSTTVLDAFAAIRAAKQRKLAEYARLREPSRSLLASNMHDLSERTETLATAAESSRTVLTSQVRTLDAKVDAIVSALGITVQLAEASGGAAGETSNGSTDKGWLQSLMGDKAPNGAGLSA